MMSTVAVIQLEAQDGKSSSAALQAVRDAVDRVGEADLYVLPEVWSPGYFCFDEYADAAEDFSALADSLSGIARHQSAYLHGGSLLERRGDRLYNTSLLFSPSGDLVGVYRKIHLFGYGSREQQLLTPGDEVVVADTELGRLGLAVCYDLRFPEQFRRMAEMGATMFVVASAWPYPRVEAWSTLLRARAAENQAHLVAANGCGPGAGAALCGRSAVVDPWGVAIASGGSDPAEFRVEVDLDAPERARKVFPQLVDRQLVRTEPGTLLLAQEGKPPFRFVTKRLILAGYTARDPEIVRSYIAGLEAKGIPPPSEVPTYFRTGRELVTTADQIDVTSGTTCGEVEFALLIDDHGRVWVAAASDHTDRRLEETSILAAKQSCPKPLSIHVWSYETVRDHWDQLILRAYTPADDPEPYQEAPAAVLLHPEDLLDRVQALLGGDMAGTVVFGGSFSSRTGSFEFYDSFRAEVHDPVLGRTLSATYRVCNVRQGGD